MPLADWLGRTRGEGFVEQLEAAAADLGLDGCVHRGLGIYVVSWRGGRHGVTVCHEEGFAAVRGFGNVRFPPSGPPEGLVRAVMRWRASEAYLSFDCHATADWSCFVVRCPIRLAAFTPRLLGCAIEEALLEVTALDRRLVEAGYGRLESPDARPRQVQAEAQRRLEAPRPAQSIVRRVADAASRLLGGW